MSSSAVPPLPVSTRTSKLAISSLILGILSFTGLGFTILPPVLAIVFGHIASSKCRREAGVEGRGLAIAGLILGYIFFAIIFLGLLAAMAIPAFQSVRTASRNAAVESNLQWLYDNTLSYSIANGVSIISYDEIVGPGMMIPEITPVADEVYPQVLHAGEPLTVTLYDGTVITYPTEEDQGGITGGY